MHIFNIPFTTNSFEKDDKNLFTGRIRNRGSFVARRKMFDMISEESHLEGLEKTMEEFISNGITTAVTVEGGALFHDKHVEILLKNKNKFPIDIELFYSTTDVKRVSELSLPRIGGDIFLDGSFRSQNAALYEPYLDSENSLGCLFFSDDELFEFILQSENLGLQVAVHAVGPRAIDTLLNAYEKVLKISGNRNHRHRIEHFELPTNRQIERAKELGLVLAMHPIYEIYFREMGDMYDTRIGFERALCTNPLKRIIDSNVIIAGCSDSDVLPAKPILGIYAAVNHPNEESRVSVFEALKMYTVNGAYGIFQENLKGTLSVGKKADIIVLSDDPMSIKKEDLKKIKVLFTMKSGKILYNTLEGANV
jgi:predicted amidohydrolase YtcJ